MHCKGSNNVEVTQISSDQQVGWIWRIIAPERERGREEEMIGSLAQIDSITLTVITRRG